MVRVGIKQKRENSSAGGVPSKGQMAQGEVSAPAVGTKLTTTRGRAWPAERITLDKGRRTPEDLEN